jgi:zinc transport system substrate-binding protein
LHIDPETGYHSQIVETLRGWWATRRLALVGILLLAGACSSAESRGRTLVASFYPLAFLAERIAALEWRVVDLTPPGAEAHDVELTLATRAELERADLVLYMGDFGFQPQVEDAVKEAEGSVLAIGEQVIHLPERTVDPHVWLDPGAMKTMAGIVARTLAEIDPGGGYRDRAEPIRADLQDLSSRYEATLDPDRCRFPTAIVSHEAFNYVLGRYGLRQFGLTGLEPEAEPTVERIAMAESLLAREEAGAVFFDPRGEGEKIAESLAADFGVPALPLSTLESEPPSGDYLSVMEDNLGSLRTGLGCR